MPIRYDGCIVNNENTTICTTFLGPRSGDQPAHDPVGHGQDEGVPGRSRDAHGPHVQNR